MSFSKDKNQYVILGVTGPNEYENNVNNNWYTNYAAKWCLDYAISRLAEIANKNPKKYSLINHNKKDSTGICFIGERKYNDFVGKYLTVEKGNIQSLDGEILGTHNGHIYFTIGQRKGLGIGARLTSQDKPWYVVKKDIDKNIIFVAQGENHPALFSKQIIVEHINWINLKTKTFPKKYFAKVRYRDKDKLCTIFSLDNDTYLVKFKSKQKAITPGQSIVLYDKEGVCIGGGIISERDIPFLKESI